METIQNTSHSGWNEVPLLNWQSLNHGTLKELLKDSKETLLIDFKTSSHLFAVKMHGNSMEPKFSEGTLLIFHSDKNPQSGDFVLVQPDNEETMFRQIFIKNNIRYIKCLNPKYKGYKLTRVLPNTINYLGVLMQARINYM